MATITGPAGSIHRGNLEQRGQQLTVTGSPAGPVWITWGKVELGRGVAGQPFDVDASKMPLGTAQITARWSGGSDTKTTTVVPDPKPGPTNTGSPQAADLEPWTGGTVLRTAGQVLEGVLFPSFVVIEANDVELRHCMVAPTSTGPGGRCLGVSGYGVRITDTTVDGTKAGAAIGLGYGNFHGQRLNIFGANDAVRIGHHATVEDSWLHDLIRKGEQHPDCVQTNGGIGSVIRHNTMQSASPGEMGNAAIQLGAEVSPVDDLLIEDNWLGGGNYTVNVRSDVKGQVTFRGNRYTGPWRHGPFAGPPWISPDVTDIDQTTGMTVEKDTWQNLR